MHVYIYISFVILFAVFINKVLNISERTCVDFKSTDRVNNI